MTKVVSANTTPSTWCFLTTSCQLPSPTEQSINQCLRYWFLKLAWWTDRITSRFKSVEVVRKWWVIVRIQPSKTSSCRFKIFLNDGKCWYQINSLFLNWWDVTNLFVYFSFTCWALDREEGKMVISMKFMACLAAQLVCFLEYWSDVVSTGGKWIPGQALINWRNAWISWH